MKIFEIVENTQVNDLNQLTVSAQQGLQKVKQGDMRGALANMEQIANGLAKLDIGTKMYNFMSKMLSAYEQQVANFPEDPDTPKLQKVIDQIQAQMPTMQKQAAQSKQYAKTARNKELDAFGGIGESKGSIEDCIRKTLKKEGGAAGLGAIKKACKDAGYTEDAQKVMKKMKDVKQHKEGDYILETTSSSAIATSMGGGNGFANGGPGVVSRMGKKKKKKVEGKSPHKKGTKKYKAHMAAMHAGQT